MDENEFQRIFTQGREQGKWVVNVIDTDGNVMEQRLTAQEIWGMANRKVILEFGPLDQPEGGSGGLFGTWLGMLCTDLSKFPINYEDWRNVQNWRKDDAWDFIQSKFYFDASNQNYKKYVMKSLSVKCKGLKTRLWQHLRRSTPEESLQVCPDFVPKEQWRDFVYMQFTEKTKKLSEQNKISRSHYKTPHTLGKKSIARISKEILLKTGKRPTRAEIFVTSRRKTNGSFVNEEAQNLSEQLKEKMAQTEGGNTSIQKDDFSQVFGIERPGRVRCVGLGPTPSTFFKNRNCAALHAAEVIGLRNKVQDLEKRLEKMDELEEKYEKMNDLLNSLASSTGYC